MRAVVLRFRSYPVNPILSACFPAASLRRLGPRSMGRARAWAVASDVGGAFVWFLHTCPLPAKSAVRSAPVSSWCVIVTRLAEGSVFVSGCEADRGAASQVRRTGNDTTSWAGRCSGLPVVSGPLQRLGTWGYPCPCHTPARALLCTTMYFPYRFRMYFKSYAGGPGRCRPFTV